MQEHLKMNSETITMFLDSVIDSDLILIHIFDEPYQFIKQNINYDVTNDNNTLAIQRKHDKREFLINISSIKSMSTISQEEYSFFKQENGVIE